MKLKYIFESVDMGDEIILVPVGEGANHVQGILKMNKEGLEIVKLLKTEISENQIVDLLSKKYVNDKETLLEYVHTVIKELTQAGVLE